MRDPKAPTPNSTAGQVARAVALYVRFLKRIAAHARNVASGIVNPFPRLRYKEKPGLQGNAGV